MKYTLFIIGLLLLTTKTEARQVEIHCPDSIQTQQQILDKPPGFTSISMPEHKFYWERITFYQGDPSEKASLVPDMQKQSIATWKFAKKDAVFMSCGYYRTNIEIFKQLPKVKTCTVIYDPYVQTAQGALPKKIACEMD